MGITKEKRTCLACAGRGISLVWGLNRDKIWHCRNCSLEWRNLSLSSFRLKEIYSSGYFSQGEDLLKKGYPDYDLFQDSYKKYFLCQLNLLYRYVKGGFLVDVGCGPGLFLKLARDKGYRVMGVDLSEEAAREAWEKFRIPVKKRELENLNFEEQSIDILTCFQTFEHFHYPRKFLRTAYRLLTPSGVLLLTTPDTNCFWRKILRTNWFSYRHQEHLFFWNKKSLRMIFKKAGFKKITFFNDDWRWYNVLELRKLFISYGGRIGRLVKKVNWGRSGDKLRFPFPVGSVGVLAEK